MADIKHKSGGRPSNRPDDETLAKLYLDHTAPQIATLYNVKTSTVRAWINIARKRQQKEDDKNERISPARKN